jgi:[ribosomal protein S5]-alanine N-acetyltransferase
VPELQRLRADHAPAVLAFELANRAYFAAFISDRGDRFFDHFTERYNALLADRAPGISVAWLPTDPRSFADDAQQRLEQ